MNFTPDAVPEQSWPTAADLVNAVKRMIEEDRKDGEPIGELDGYLDVADTMFPDAPQGVPAAEGDAILAAYHARAMEIMTAAQAELEDWLDV